MLIKLVLGEEIINILSAYAPQVGVPESNKRFGEKMDGLIQEILRGEKLFIGGDLNGHVSKKNMDMGCCTKVIDMILDVAIFYDLIVINTCFKKRDKH